MSRVLVIGLDCVPPKLVFERHRQRMPHLSRLMQAGTYGALRSTFPPITVPAWTSMVSGRDPGELGMYGFRTREPGAYGLRMHVPRDIAHPRVWDLLGDAGRRVSALFVPPSFPPSPLNGEQLGCFLTPDGDADFAFPPQLKGELRVRFGEYIPDVAHVGATADRHLLERIEAMTAQHFAIAKHIWETRDPDFMMFVAIGPDRVHHAFYRQIDPAHPQHDPACELGDVGARYYAFLDARLGELLESVDEDTLVLVASDHGAKPLEGAFRINAWLAENGYLAFHSQPSPDEAIHAHVDWARTRAWAEGGYYARVFLNVAGREPEGILEPAEVAVERERLQQQLESVRGPGGSVWQNQVRTPQQLYRRVTGNPPDLLAVFDDLRVRPVATLGDGGLYAAQDDRGNDACNHDWNGMFVAAGAGVAARPETEGAEIYDIGATILAAAGIDAPADFRGRDLRSPQ